MQRDKESEYDVDRIDREAAEWLAKSSRGLTSEEQRAYERWLSKDARHWEWIDRHSETRSGLAGLSALLPVDGEPDPDAFAPPKAIGARSKRILLASVSAIAASVAVAFLALNDWRLPSALPFSDYSESFAAIGFERHFLPDGTLVELKAGSELRTRFDSERRRIDLVRGEAHFSIQSDPQRPFQVHVGDTVFSAVGTAFNVRLSLDEVELIVTEGVVRIDKADAPKNQFKSAGNSSLGPRLGVNQRAVVALAEQGSAPEIATVDKSFVDEKLEWKHEILEFDATPLSMAVQAFNLRNRDQIEIADRSLQDELIDGSFRSDNVVGFVKLLEISGDIDVARYEDGRIVFSQKRQ